jgi:hypothetical protein
MLSRMSVRKYPGMPDVINLDDRGRVPQAPPCTRG